MKTENRKSTREALRVTCRHIAAMILAAALLIGIAAAENGREMVRVSWGGEQEVYEEGMTAEEEKELNALDGRTTFKPGMLTVYRDADGDPYTSMHMCDIIELDELKEIMAASGYPEPGKLFDSWTVTNVNVYFNCARDAEYHLVGSERDGEYIREDYAIDAEDKILTQYYVTLEKDGQKTNLMSRLIGGPDVSIIYSPEEVPQTEDVSIPGMEKAMYIIKQDGHTSLRMCRPLGKEVYLRVSPDMQDVISDYYIYDYELLEIDDVTPEEVIPLFSDGE